MVEVYSIVSICINNGNELAVHKRADKPTLGSHRKRCSDRDPSAMDISGVWRSGCNSPVVFCYTQWDRGASWPCLLVCLQLL